MLAFRLVAHGVGGRTVRELSEGGMDEEELLTWAAYLGIEPFGADRMDVHFARLMAQQHNMHRGKGRPAKQARDFMVEWHGAARPEMTVEQMEVVLQAHYLARGGDPAKFS